MTKLRSSPILPSHLKQGLVFTVSKEGLCQKFIDPQRRRLRDKFFVAGHFRGLFLKLVRCCKLMCNRRAAIGAAIGAVIGRAGSAGAKWRGGDEERRSAAGAERSAQWISNTV